jgi:hypothetical protein
MDITRALHRAVHNHPAGTAALAAQMGMSRHTLTHKCSPTDLTAHCSPEEAAMIMEITGDHGPLQAMADRLGYICLSRMACDEATDGELVAAVREFGEFLHASSSGMADGQVSDNELGRIEAEASDAISRINQLVAKARAINQAGKPVELREVRAQSSERAQAHR